MGKNELTGVRLSEKKLKILEESILGLGKEGYPFRHKDYELATCIPCSDFSNWIIDRLEENDIWAIKLLEWEICRGLGLSVGISNDENQVKHKNKKLDVYFWSSCIGVDNQLSKELDKFITISPKILSEIYCLLIRTHISKETAYGYFYDPNDYAYKYQFKTFVDALSCYKLDFNTNNIIEELDSANSIYLKYMNEYRSEKIVSHMFNCEDLNIDYALIENNELADRLSQLSIGSRLQFWDLINSSYFISNIRINRRKNLECWFRTNAFGFDKVKSNSNLFNAGLINLINNKEIILSFLTRKELSDALSNFNISLKPSTGKSILIKKLLEIRTASDYIFNFAKSKGLYFFNPNVEDDLRRLIEYKKQVSKIFLLLCTIDFGFVFRRSFFLNDNGMHYLVYEDNLKEKIPLIYGN